MQKQQFPDISAMVRSGLQTMIDRHAYSVAFEARLGDGTGRVKVPSPEVPRLVFARLAATNYGDVIQAVQAEWIPYADSVGGASLDGLPVMIGRRPKIHGGGNRFFVIATDTTLASLSAVGNSPIVYQIINNTNVTQAAISSFLMSINFS